MATRREEVLDRVRKFLGRAFGRWFAPRHGWFFITRRTVTSLLTEVARAGGAPEGYEVLSVDDVAASVPGARVHRPDPGYPVIELPYGMVIGPKGHVGASPRCIAAEFSFRAGRDGIRTIRRESGEVDAEGDVVELRGVTATLLQDSYRNYCHWLTQGFVRLQLLDRTVGTAGIDQILVPPEPPPFLFEALAEFGIDRSLVVEIPDEPRLYRCEHLIAAGLPRRPDDSPRWALDDARARYGRPARPDAPRRVYLQRGSTTRRRVANEDAVLDTLAARGFEAFTLDGRTIAEQSDIVAAAECIVGAHGAALTNLVFAPPTTTLVELQSKNWAYGMFRDLAATMGVRYVAVMGIEPGIPSWLVRRRHLIDADIVVDVDALGRTLDDLGLR